MILMNDICSDSSILSLILFIKKILNVVKILLPVALIVLGMVDMAKAVFQSDDRQMAENKNKFLVRLLAAVIVFFVPTVINFCFESIDGFELEYVDCWTAATKSNIEKIKTKEKKLENVKTNVEQETFEKKAEEETTKKKQSENEKKNSSSGNKSGNNSKREKIVEYASSFINKLSYVYGGESLKNGADCSGFVMKIYENFGVSLPRTASSQRSFCKSISRDELRKGDLVFYSDERGVYHVALYVGNGKIVHSWCSSCNNGKVTKSNIDYSTNKKLYGNCLGD